MRALVLVAVMATVLVSGCGRREQAAAPASPPPPAGVDFAGPFNALGGEPFWSLKIRPEGLSFSAPSMVDITAPNPGPKAGSDLAVWSGMGSDGRALTATLRAAVCEDPMSGASYPFTATVEAGGRVLKGCAVNVRAMLKPGS